MFSNIHDIIYVGVGLYFYLLLDSSQNGVSVDFRYCVCVLGCVSELRSQKNYILYCPERYNQSTPGLADFVFCMNSGFDRLE